MKRLLFLSLVSISCSGSPSQMSTTEAKSYLEMVSTDAAPVFLEGIQERISNAFVQAFIVRKDEALVDLSKSLESLDKENKQNLILYWRSYLQFYASIYYLNTGEKKAAEKAVDQGIEWLKSMPNMNSEDYALLSMLQGFALQFKGLKVMFLAGEVKTNALNAIAIDSTNLRAYYVYASNDYYTPEKYGGGQHAEEYLLKALSLPEQHVANAYLPSWGKQETYELLINLYINRENWEEAKKHFAEAIKLFPESYQLNQLASKLVGK